MNQILRSHFRINSSQSLSDTYLATQARPRLSDYSYFGFLDWYKNSSSQPHLYCLISETSGNNFI